MICVDLQLTSSLTEGHSWGSSTSASYSNQSPQILEGLWLNSVPPSKSWDIASTWTKTALRHIYSNSVVTYHPITDCCHISHPQTAFFQICSNSTFTKHPPTAACHTCSNSILTHKSPHHTTLHSWAFLMALLNKP